MPSVMDLYAIVTLPFVIGTVAGKVGPGGCRHSGWTASGASAETEVDMASRPEMAEWRAFHPFDATSAGTYVLRVSAAAGSGKYTPSVARP